MNKLIVLFSLIFLSVSCTDAQEAKSMKTTQTSEVINKVVDAKTFHAIRMEKKVVLIDVRTPGEFAQGHIKGAMNIDHFSDDFKARIDGFDKNVTTLIYCASGRRSGNTARMMKEQGFKEVYDLEGGFNSWPY